MERSGLRFEHFSLKLSKIAAQKKVFFVVADFALQNMDDFFRFSKKLGFWVFLVHPETTVPDGLETSGQRA